MRKGESFAQRYAARSEEQEVIENTKEKLGEFLRLEADRLRSEGFLVDDELRIDPEGFQGFISGRTIQRDIAEAEQLEREFTAKSTRESEAQAVRGEVLEMAKALLFNRELFGGKLVTVRTSKYDDYKNGVDELIFDTETWQPMAAVDTTMNFKTKAATLADKINNGCRVKYGLSPGESGVKLIQYSGLPLFIISLSSERLAAVAKGLVIGLSEEERKDLENEFLRALRGQAERASKIAPERMALSYQQSAELFARLTSWD